MNQLIELLEKAIANGDGDKPLTVKGLAVMLKTVQQWEADEEADRDNDAEEAMHGL